MDTSLSVRRFSRRVVSVAAAGALSLAAVSVTSSPSEAAVSSQKVTVGVSTVGQAFTSAPVRADFTVANPSTNTGSVAAFTIVVPPGVTRVAPAGVTGPGNWRQAVLPCGAITGCSALVLVYASLPFSTSVLKPGKSLTTSIIFTTGASPSTLSFPFIGVGYGLFTASSTPTINVISGDAADFLITSTTSLVTAGDSGSFVLATRNAGGNTVPFAGGNVTFTLGTEDAGATLGYNGSTYSFTGAPSQVTVNLPSSGSSLGTYPFAVKFTAAGPTSVTATLASNLQVHGSYALTVVPGAPSKVNLLSVTDQGTGAGVSSPTTLNPPPNGPLFVGQPIVVQFTVQDAYGNGVATSSGVTVTTTGVGVFTPLSSTASTGNDIASVTGTYNKSAAAVSFGVSVASVVSPSTTLTDAVVVGTGTGLFVPGVPGVLTSTNFAPPVAGEGQCSFATITVVCASANLPAGANGAVTLALEQCPATLQFCLDNTNNTVANLSTGPNGFKAANGAPLYDAANPVTFLYGCSVTECPHKVNGVNDDLLSNGVYFVYNEWEESVEDYNAYPLRISYPATPLTYDLVPACQIGTLNGNVTVTSISQGTPLPSVTNLVALRAYQAQAPIAVPLSKACVDVTNILRNTTSTDPAVRGQVVFPIYFFDDPKIIVGR